MYINTIYNDIVPTFMTKEINLHFILLETNLIPSQFSNDKKLQHQSAINLLQTLTFINTLWIC